MEIVIFAVILAAVLILREVVDKKFGGAKKSKSKTTYHYERKTYLMGKSENDLLKLLVEAVGPNYYVFPQIHVSAIFNHKVKGQNWKAAFQHINGKSVDFVVCDKQYCKPVLAIELDDASHSLQDRIDRDFAVEAMFVEANLPLLRFDDKPTLTRELVFEMVSRALSDTKTA